MQAKPKTVAVIGGCRNPGVIQRWLTLLSLSFCMHAGVASVPLSRAADSLRPKHILILDSFTDRKALGDPGLLKSTLRSHLGAPANFDVKYLESQRFDVGGYENSLSESLAHLYRGRKINLIIAVVQRWNIPESSLPPNALVLFRQPTVWEQYRGYVLSGLALIIVQGLLILGLLIQRGRKCKAEIRLRESEKRFRTMADATPSLVWMSDKSGLVTYFNERRIDFTGRNSTDGHGDSWAAFVHPDDLQGVLSANQLALEQRKGFSKEYRLRRRDGVYRWMLDVAAPRIDGDGAFAGFIGSASDVTDQKLAQEALKTIGGRLIAAQEKERSRIARELHDDICQRLALLYMELTQAIEGANDLNGTASTQIAEIRQHCSEIAGDVQALSHELHSSKLDYLGVVAALVSFCQEFSKQHNIEIEFTHKAVPDSLASDISLCLFRVAQEALHNAAKYSGESRFSIDLRRIEDQLQLEVRDAGVGFNPEQAKLNGGLGLVSMQERVHLVNGTFLVETKVNHGTRIIVSVPCFGEWSETANVGAESRMHRRWRWNEYESC